MIGKLLREARTSRNFTPGDVADAWNRMRNTDRFTAARLLPLLMRLGWWLRAKVEST